MAHGATGLWLIPLLVTAASCQSDSPAAVSNAVTASVDADTAGIIGVVLTGFGLLGILAAIIHNARTHAEEEDEENSMTRRGPVFRSLADSVPYHQQFAVGPAQKPTDSWQDPPSPEAQAVFAVEAGRHAPASLQTHSLESHTAKDVSDVPPPSAAAVLQDELPEYWKVIGSLDEALESKSPSVKEHGQREEITLASSERMHVNATAAGGATQFFQGSQVQYTATTSFTSTSLAFHNYAYEEDTFATADYAATHSRDHLAPVPREIANGGHQANANQGRQPEDATGENEAYFYVRL